MFVNLCVLCGTCVCVVCVRVRDHLYQSTQTNKWGADELVLTVESCNINGYLVLTGEANPQLHSGMVLRLLWNFYVLQYFLDGLHTGY